MALGHIEDIRSLFMHGVCDRIRVRTAMREHVIPCTDLVVFEINGFAAYRFGGMGTVTEDEVMLSQMDRDYQITLLTAKGQISITPLEPEEQLITITKRTLSN